MDDERLFKEFAKGFDVFCSVCVAVAIHSIGTVSPIAAAIDAVGVRLGDTIGVLDGFVRTSFSGW